MKLGVIDVGSNAMRVLIADITQVNGRKNLAKIAYLRLPVRLGEDVFEVGRISDEKVEKLIQGLHTFQAVLNFYNVSIYRAVATSAMRDSENEKKILQRIKKEVKMNLEVITGKEEAEFVYLNFELMPQMVGDFLLIDVGGGSTEITLFCQNEVHIARSFQIGTVRYLKGKVEESEIQDMKNWIQSEVLIHHPQKIFGTGGNISSVHKILDLHDMESVKLRQMNQLKSDLLPLNIEERIFKYKIKQDRADVIVPAIEIYSSIIEQLGVEEIFVPKMGLSDGVLLDLYNQIKV
ncbi:MAG: hypothetical protein WCG64_01050 [Flavobacteriia bacterium]|jgi:exopolyphosphatase/guanosine-5'-triphosphate,3'-diphosphate pyrophosphatase